MIFSIRCVQKQKSMDPEAIHVWRNSWQEVTAKIWWRSVTSDLNHDKHCFWHLYQFEQKTAGFGGHVVVVMVIWASDWSKRVRTEILPLTLQERIPLAILTTDVSVAWQQLKVDQNHARKFCPVSWQWVESTLVSQGFLKEKEHKSFVCGYAAVTRQELLVEAWFVRLRVYVCVCFSVCSDA